jgi:hypothetical protein
VRHPPGLHTTRQQLATRAAGMWHVPREHPNVTTRANTCRVTAALKSRRANLSPRCNRPHRGHHRPATPARSQGTRPSATSLLLVRHRVAAVATPAAARGLTRRHGSSHHARHRARRHRHPVPWTRVRAAMTARGRTGCGFSASTPATPTIPTAATSTALTMAVSSTSLTTALTVVRQREMAPVST